jgi:hypothetical protein
MLWLASWTMKPSLARMESLTLKKPGTREWYLLYVLSHVDSVEDWWSIIQEGLELLKDMGCVLDVELGIGDICKVCVMEEVRSKFYPCDGNVDVDADL